MQRRGPGLDVLPPDRRAHPRISPDGGRLLVEAGATSSIVNWSEELEQILGSSAGR
jgi:hypothetical protein